MANRATTSLSCLLILSLAVCGAPSTGCFPPAIEQDWKPDLDELHDVEDSDSEDSADGAAGLTAPQGLMATDDLEDRVRLVWDPTHGADAYHVYRGAQRLTAGSGVAIPSFDDYQAPAVDGAWPAPTDLSASVERSDGVQLTWKVPIRPMGPEASYAVTAVFGGLEGPPSLTATGRRAARSIDRFEVEVTLEGAASRWVDTGASEPEWVHIDAPQSTLALGALTASRGDFVARVRLVVDDVAVVPAPHVSYRVRAALAGGGYTPSSAAVNGRRGVAALSFDWQRSNEPLGSFSTLASGSVAHFDDIAPPGDGSAAYYRVEVRAEGATPSTSELASGWRLSFAALAGGNDFMCGLTPTIPDGGRVWCWGRNTNGQLGVGSTGGVLGPRRIEGLSNVVKVSAAGANACALVAGSGEVYCWGRLARLFEGTDTRPRRIPGISMASDIRVAGSTVACAATSTSVLCWGVDTSSYGLLGDGSAGEARFSPMPVLEAADLPVPRLTFGAGNGFHMCGHDESTLFCWGNNSSGQLGPDAPSPKSPYAVRVALPDGLPDTAAVSNVSTCGQWGDELRCWGRLDGSLTSATPVNMASLVGAVAIEGGGSHLCVQAGEGVYCFGDNTAGQLGLGHTLEAYVPTRVLDLGVVQALGVGGAATCALLDGAPWCWGFNDDRMLQVEPSDTFVLAPSRVLLPE